jgi:hypothetical protein
MRAAVANDAACTSRSTRMVEAVLITLLRGLVPCMRRDSSGVRR